MLPSYPDDKEHIMMHKLLTLFAAILLLYLDHILYMQWLRSVVTNEIELFFACLHFAFIS